MLVPFSSYPQLIISGSECLEPQNKTCQVLCWLMPMSLSICLCGVGDGRGSPWFWRCQEQIPRGRNVKVSQQRQGSPGEWDAAASCHTVSALLKESDLVSSSRKATITGWGRYPSLCSPLWQRLSCRATTFWLLIYLASALGPGAQGPWARPQYSSSPPPRV